LNFEYYHPPLNRTNAPPLERMATKTSLATKDWKARKVWEPDSDATACPCCEAAFSVQVRKHHCRACGRVVCGTCSGAKQKVPGYEQPERVCDQCAAGPPGSSALARLCGALCGCLAESPEAAAKRERRLALTSGTVFVRKRGMLFGKQKLLVKLSEEGGLRCTPVDAAITDSSAPEEYPLVDIGTVGDSQGWLARVASGGTRGQGCWDGRSADH